jgi:hypothetical protein
MKSIANNAGRRELVETKAAYVETLMVAAISNHLGYSEVSALLAIMLHSLHFLSVACLWMRP